MSLGDLLRATEAEPLPRAIVDLDAFDRNLDRHLALLAGRRTPIRIATKSVRVPGLLRRLLDRARDGARGLMCFSAFEALYLAEQGFDDLLVAYPSLDRHALDALASAAKLGRDTSIAVDSIEGLDALSAAGVRNEVTLKAVICCDMSLDAALLGRVGVRRSPLHTPEEVLALARVAREKDRVRVHGVLAYEALVAGVADAAPGQGVMNQVLRALKKRSIADVRERRSAIVSALEKDGFELALVNGGGTGSLESTTRESGVTEVAAGSGFFKPHLFDGYASAFVRSLEPAAFFALEVTRRPARGFVTCLGGGYVASGAVGRDRAPLPVHPAGLSLVPHEMAGEVQTPLRGEAADAIALGAAVLFRHAKAGELMERFDRVCCASAGKIALELPTYRGDRRTFP